MHSLSQALKIHDWVVKLHCNHQKSQVKLTDMGEFDARFPDYVVYSAIIMMAILANIHHFLPVLGVSCTMCGCYYHNERP